MATTDRTVDLDAATILDLAAAMASGALTSEQLIRLSLARMDAYDGAGPCLNAVIARNPRAIDQARALDAERRAKGPRSPLHGMPVVLKDNYDTADLPTTGGSVFLEGSIPPDDAFLVKQLREAGAVILAKVNLSEFAAGGPFSSLGGETRNPHDPLRTPYGSSGGTGVAVAAGYAVLGMGSDTGGSVRLPASANGIVGLRPTLGLLSRDGIIPLSLSLDTGGPMARSVTDVAVALGVLVGVDPADPATAKSAGKFAADYTAFLQSDALKGARIGVARDFGGHDDEVDGAVEAAVAAMAAAGAALVDISFPKWLLDTKDEFLTALRMSEFPPQVKAYLATLKPGYPQTLAEIIERADAFTAPRPDGAAPNPGRWAEFRREQASPPLTDARYTAIRDHALPLVAAAVDGVLAGNRLDAFVYPTLLRRPPPLSAPPPAPQMVAASGINLSALAGLPELVVPAGFTTDGLPVGISFVGRAFDEGRLLRIGYAFEQATKARRQPAHTPPLDGERLG